MSLPRPAARALRALVTASVGLLGTVAAHASVIFADGSMDPTLFSATPTFASAGVTVTSSQTAAVGSSTPALLATSGVVSGQSGYAFVAGYLYGAFTWDPASQGAIAAMDFSMDRGAEVLQNGAPLPGITLTARALVQQGGNVYMAISAPVAPLTLPDLTPVSAAGLVETSFGLFDTATGAVDFAVNPDFDGAAMTFGFAMRLFVSGVPTTESFVLNAYADSFRLELFSAAVPEPPALTLAALALALVALPRRRPKPLSARAAARLCRR